MRSPSRQMILAKQFRKSKRSGWGRRSLDWERAKPHSTPLTKLVEDYLTAAQERGKKPLRPETAKVRRYILESYAKTASIEFPSQITHRSISEWIAGLKLAPDTVHSYARHLHTFVGYLVRMKHVRSELLDDFQVPEKGAHGRKNWLKKKEAERVIAESKDPELTFVLYCGFHAGLRRNEIVNAKVGWFELETGDTGLVHIQNDPGSGFVLKDRENRSVPLTKDFKQFLHGFLANRKLDEYAIRPAKLQGPWRYRYEFSRAFKSYMKRCGVTCSIHDMRRSFASNLVSAGESIYIVARWLGDGVQVVERSYGHLAPSAGNIDRLTAKVA
ncbi:MAG: tyrosine-type recombinase/integrase [Chthoniobacterales bacterium]